jgi:hypothetical protein
MSGKAKMAHTKAERAEESARRGAAVKVTRVLEWRRNSQGNLVPKYHWERQS